MARIRRTRAWTILSALCLASVLAAANLAFAGGTFRIAQKGREFALRSVEIAAGDVIQFTNDDEFLHQIFVTSSALKFDSAEQPPGEVIDVTFPSPGIYSVRCHIHPKMLLSVVVR